MLFVVVIINDTTNAALADTNNNLTTLSNKLQWGQYNIGVNKTIGVIRTSKTGLTLLKARGSNIISFTDNTNAYFKFPTNGTYKFTFVLAIDTDTRVQITIEDSTGTNVVSKCTTTTVNGMCQGIISATTSNYFTIRALAAKEVSIYPDSINGYCLIEKLP